MDKDEKCQNCKYHYVEEISFDYPQSCCSKRKITTEQWLNCSEFEYSEDYINDLKQQVKKQKEAIDKINKYLNEYDVFKVFSFPLMKRWEEEQIKSSIDYEFKTSLVKDLKDILKEVSE